MAHKREPLFSSDDATPTPWARARELMAGSTRDWKEIT
jgi:hypothetical protein